MQHTGQARGHLHSLLPWVLARYEKAQELSRRVDVGARVALAEPELLGRGVPHRPPQLRIGMGAAARASGNSEVDEVGVLAVEYDVRRVDIAMDDRAARSRVEHLDGAAHIVEDDLGTTQIGSLVLVELLDRGAINPLEHDDEPVSHAGMRNDVGQKRAADGVHELVGMLLFRLDLEELPDVALARHVLDELGPLEAVVLQQLDGRIARGVVVGGDEGVDVVSSRRHR